MIGLRRIKPRHRRLVALGSLFLALLVWSRAEQTDSFRFVILGDRTGETQPGVYEQVWKEAAAENPALVVAVGDTIEGLKDQNLEAEWRQVDQMLQPFRRYTLYLAPGNHDVWSAASQRMFTRHAPGLHYSFDYGRTHFTILDTSRSDQLATAELVFLEEDLKAHAEQRFKFIVTHRPSWLVDVAFQNPRFALHQLARRYGVQYIVAGHVHQMLHSELDGVTYVSMPSSGGHLRSPETYEAGWFFGHALVELSGNGIEFQIKEVHAPFGKGRTTKLADWGLAGLLKERQPE